MYTSMGSSPAMLRSPLLMVFVNEVKSSHALITRFCQFWPGNSKSYVNATTMIAIYIYYMWILEIGELNLKTTKSNLNMLVGFAFVLWDTQGKWGMPRWWENTLPSPRTPLQFMFVWKKNDLLCKNPGFQDSPIAMSRTCKIALKAPLEASYSALAG